MNVRRCSSRCQDDRGVVAVVVALSLTALLLFVAFAIDGGSAYQSHRQAQNAADSGAMTGVYGLEELRFKGASTTYTSALLVEKIKESAQNTGDGGATTAVSCYLLMASGTRTTVDMCAGTFGPFDFQINLSAGVEVRTEIVRRTYFAGLAGQTSITTRAVAKAFIQNLSGSIKTPFIVCGFRGTNMTQDNAFDIMQVNNGVYTVKPAAVGKHYQLQAAQVPDCASNGGSNSDFKGKADKYDPPTVPGDVRYDTGNGFEATISVQVVGMPACTTADNGVYNGCGMLIPIASGNGATAGTVHLVTWVVMKVWGDGSPSFNFNNIPAGAANSWPVGSSCRTACFGSNASSMKYCGMLVSMINVAAGTGAAGIDPTAGMPHVIKLTA